MSRDATVAVVEAFFDCIVRKDLAAAPVASDFTAQSPLVPQLRGPDARAYLERVAAGVRAIHIRQHVVEGEWIVTLFDEDLVAGVTLPVLSKFHVVDGRIRDVIVFYDPRKLPG